MAVGSMLTRREATLAALAAAGSTATLNAFAQARPTAAQVADRIRQHYGAAWKTGAVDGFAAGDPQVAVTGVAVMAMPNMVALHKAVAAGCNMVVSLESPLYAKPYVAPATPGPFDPGAMVAQFRADPTYVAKQRYIADNKLAIYRLDENLRAETPQPLVQGIADAMNWQRYRDKANAQVFVIPRTNLRTLTATVKKRLGLNGGMRTIGKGDMSVSRVLVVPGRIDPVAVVKLLPSVDVLLCGDLREWELVEYFHDSWETASPKALIAVGRIISEQPGMLAAVNWLRGLAGVPVKPVMVEDPYWRLPA